MSGPRYAVDGVQAPVEILVDTWGVAHISAADAADLFFAQGFNAARERLFQMDLWRRRGLGLLAEVLGPDYVNQDRARRLFLYRGSLEEEWESYGSLTKRAVVDFTAGLNSYIKLCDQAAVLLPEEFAYFGYRPSPWQPEDIVRIRSHGLHHNLEQEVSRWGTLAQYGDEVEDLRRVREPSMKLRLADELRGYKVPADLLRDYRLATSPITSPGEPSLPGEGQGSNNWVVAAHRTATGRPILANDPHRALNLPSLRYVVHLRAPGIDVIGGGEPMLPGISIGHNGVAAFGLTVFPADQEDLYVYEAKRDTYRYGDGWDVMQEVVEEIAVKDSPPVSVTLKFTRHGPVIYEDVEHGRAFAVRAAWLSPGMVPYLGSIRYMGAQTWDEFVEALKSFGGPPENFVYADSNGHIGWTPAGRVPTRPNWDGSLPVPGSGAFEWGEFRSLTDLACESNPERGWLASANEFNLHGLAATAAAQVAQDWYPRSRYERIAATLRGNSQIDIYDCLQLQTDYRSEPALEVLARTLETLPSEATELPGLRMLRDWNGIVSPDSAGAALFEVWYRRHFRHALFRQVLTDRVEASDLDDALWAVLPQEDVSADSRVDLMILRNLTRYLGPDGQAEVSRIVMQTVDLAMGELTMRLGPDPTSWRWGDLHQAHFVHPLRSLYESAPTWTSVGPIGRGGSGDTVGQAAYNHSFRQSSGATFRVVIDVGDWDNSIAMNAPGQSGRAASPHHHDLAETWGNDGAFPLLYSARRIEEATSETYSIVPSPSIYSPSVALD